MRWLAILVVLVSPTLASGQNCTFGDWARDQGYEPGDLMPWSVRADESGIDSLDGIGDYDWTTTPTTWLRLYRNQISSIESGGFSGLANLTFLALGNSQISSLESGGFSGLTNLGRLNLYGNQLSSLESGALSGLTNLISLHLEDNIALTELNLSDADLSNLTRFDLGGNVNITSVSLRNTVLNQTSLAVLLDGGWRHWRT